MRTASAEKRYIMQVLSNLNSVGGLDGHNSPPLFTADKSVSIEIVKDYPKQEEGWECGYYMLMMMRLIKKKYKNKINYKSETIMHDYINKIECMKMMSRIVLNSKAFNVGMSKFYSLYYDYCMKKIKNDSAFDNMENIDLKAMKGMLKTESIDIFILKRLIYHIVGIEVFIESQFKTHSTKNAFDFYLKEDLDCVVSLIVRQNYTNRVVYYNPFGICCNVNDDVTDSINTDDNFSCFDCACITFTIVELITRTNYLVDRSTFDYILKRFSSDTKFNKRIALFFLTKLCMTNINIGLKEKRTKVIHSKGSKRSVEWLEQYNTGGIKCYLKYKSNLQFINTAIETNSIDQVCNVLNKIPHIFVSENRLTYYRTIVPTEKLYISQKIHEYTDNAQALLSVHLLLFPIVIKYRQDKIIFSLKELINISNDTTININLSKFLACILDSHGFSTMGNMNIRYCILIIECDQHIFKELVHIFKKIS